MSYNQLAEFCGKVSGPLPDEELQRRVFWQFPECQAYLKELQSSIPKYLITGSRRIRLHTRKEMKTLHQQFKAWRKDRLAKRASRTLQCHCDSGLETDLGVTNPDERARSQREAALRENVLRKQPESRGSRWGIDDLYCPDFSTEP